MFKKLLLLMSLVIGLSWCTHAQGTCPTAIQYTNPALLGVAGPFVTLASLGVTHCYYIAANGSDTVCDGTTETVSGSHCPWQHAPKMPAATGNAAAHTPAPGDGYIFRGGDTWHEFTGSPIVGLPPGWPNSGLGSCNVNCNGWEWSVSGTTTNLIYIGVDYGWSVSSPWTRVVINNDNPVNPTPTYGPVAGLPPFYFNDTAHPITLNGIVASCAFPQGNLNDIHFDSSQYIMFEGFEFTGICFDGSNGTLTDNYVQHDGPGSATEYTYFYNLYGHGITHAPFVNKGLINANASIVNAGTGYTTSSKVAVNGGTLLPIVQVTSVNGSGGVTGFNVLYGGTGVPNGTDSTTTVSGPGSGLTLSVTQTSVFWHTPAILAGGTQAYIGNQYLNIIVDGSDEDDTTISPMSGGAYIVGYSYFRNFGGTQIFTNCHTLHDTVFDGVNNSTDAISHGDVYFCDGEFAGDNFFYNNLFRNIGNKYNIALSTVMWWNKVATGFTDFVYNNVFHDIHMAQGTACPNWNNMQAVAGSSIAVYNNTLQNMDATPGNACAPWTNSGFAGTITDANNHYITGTATTTTCAGMYATPSVVNGGNTSCSGDLFMNQATANAAGYTSSNDYAPISVSSPSNTGASNQTSQIPTFGSPFGNSTSLACTESMVNAGRGVPTVLCPTLTSFALPATGTNNWPFGAYYIPGTAAPTPTPPISLLPVLN
jgi:hypothetical protein